MNFFLFSELLFPFERSCVFPIRLPETHPSYEDSLSLHAGSTYMLIYESRCYSSEGRFANLKHYIISVVVSVVVRRNILRRDISCHLLPTSNNWSNPLLCSWNFCWSTSQKWRVAKMTWTRFKLKTHTESQQIVWDILSNWFYFYHFTGFLITNDRRLIDVP